MNPIEQITQIKNKIFTDLQEIKTTSEQQSLTVKQSVNEKTDELRKDLVELVRAVEEQTGKTNWQLSSAANTLKELREIIYEYCIPTQDPYSYPAQLAAYRLDNPEISLIQYLRSFLPTKNAMDIGSHNGRITDMLMSAGYKVYAFEPNETLCEELNKRYEGNTDFKAFPMAIGAEDGHATLFNVRTSEEEKGLFGEDLSQYATLIKHALPDGAWFAEPDEVQLRTLKTLHQNRVVPVDVSVVISDTEGGDIDVIHGMGKNMYHCVMTKFWDGKHRFSQDKIGLLEHTVAEMRRRGYGWHIVIYRVFDGETTSTARYFANIDRSVEQSSGFAIFFRDYSLFAEALKWCGANLRQNESFR